MEQIVNKIFNIYLNRIKTRGWNDYPLIPFTSLQKLLNISTDELHGVLTQLSNDGLMWEWDAQTNPDILTHQWGLTYVDEVYSSMVYCGQTRQLLAK